LDPISPELVLVDRELARAERARLAERAQLAELRRNDPPVDVAALRRALDATTAEEPSEQPVAFPRAIARIRPLLAPAVVIPILVTAGILAAVALVRSGRSTTPPYTVDPSRAQAARSKYFKPIRRGKSPTRPAAVPRLRTSAPTSPKVERDVLALVLRSPARRLPAQLIDPNTGLAVTNLQVSCRGLTASRSFLCVVRLPDAAPLQGVYILYRPGRNGGGTFTWYRPKVSS
jgi:hypothetical protein